MQGQHGLSLELRIRLFQEEIKIPVPGGIANRWHYACRLGRALCSAIIEPFATHRWCTSLGTIQRYGLLFAVHSIGKQAIPRWLVVLEGKVPKSLSHAISVPYATLLADLCVERFMRFLVLS